MRSPPLKACRLTHPVDAAWTPAPKQRGEFRFEDREGLPAAPPAAGERGRFGYACPREGGYCGGIAIVNGPKPEGARRLWGWDGNLEAPTLAPSINCLAHNPENPAEKYGGCGWHGWLRKGQFTEA